VGLGDVYKRQISITCPGSLFKSLPNTNCPIAFV